ncbi:hypothetical protein HY090_00235 [Candidatus Kaiserbacteria bacterium]|nr:hypothetical protein [Candidatus Kaiserbacteria bacterium]
MATDGTPELERKSYREAQLPDYSKNVSIEFNETSGDAIPVVIGKGKATTIREKTGPDGQITSKTLEVGVGTHDNFGVRRVVSAARKLVRESLQQGFKTIAIAY